MKFGPVAVQSASGMILAHNVARRGGRGAFRKGKRLSAVDVAALQAEGYATVYAAELEPGDLDEDQAACQVAKAAQGSGLALRGATQGRVDLAATLDGVLRIDAGRVERLNGVEGIAFATLPAWHMVRAGQAAAVVKVVPYAMPRERVELAAIIAGEGGALAEVRALRAQAVGLLLSGGEERRASLLRTYEAPLRRRVEEAGSRVTAVEYAALDGRADEACLAATLERLAGQGAETIILAGETSIMDRNDLAPRAVTALGGEVVCVGAPLEPGNLLMLGYLGAIPVMGVPGCARSPRKNGIDRVLPALLAGYRLGAADVARLGYGGLMV